MAIKSSNAQNHQHTLTWNNYQKMIDKLHPKIKNYVFTGIIPVLRGGGVIAISLSHKLNIPLASPVELQTTGMYLVVDDISDSGKTLTRFVQAIKTHRRIIKTLTLFRKPDTIFEPDYCLETATKWVSFPWENQ